VLFLPHFYTKPPCFNLNTKEGKFSISLEEGSTIQNLLNKLGLPEDITKLILVNGIKPNSNEIQLQYGDVVAIFPPMAGG